MGGKQDAKGDRKREHPLAHRHARDDGVDQVGSGLRHAPRSTVAMSAYYLKNVMPQWSLSTIYRVMGEFMVIQLLCLGIIWYGRKSCCGCRACSSSERA